MIRIILRRKDKDIKCQVRANISIHNYHVWIEPVIHSQSQKNINSHSYSINKNKDCQDQDYIMLKMINLLIKISYFLKLNKINKYKNPQALLIIKNKDHCWGIMEGLLIKRKDCFNIRVKALDQQLINKYPLI